jgi:hypothetical protein
MKRSTVLSLPLLLVFPVLLQKGIISGGRRQVLPSTSGINVYETLLVSTDLAAK